MTQLPAVIGRYFLIAGFLPSLALLTLIRLVVLPVLPSDWQARMSRMAASGLSSDLALYAFGPLFLGALLVVLGPLIVWFYRTGLRHRASQRVIRQHNELTAQLRDRAAELAHAGPDEERWKLEADVHALLQSLKRLGAGSVVLDSTRLRSTRIGNIWSAMEEYPELRYGMVAGTMWPRLRAVLPKAVSDAINSQNASFMFLLNLSACTNLFVVLWVGIGILAIVGLICIPTALWSTVLPSTVAISYAFYRLAASAASTMSELVASAFDLYRGELLKQYRIDLTRTVDSELKVWRQLGAFIELGDSRFYPMSSNTEC